MASFDNSKSEIQSAACSDSISSEQKKSVSATLLNLNLNDVETAGDGKSQLEDEIPKILQEDDWSNTAMENTKSSDRDEQVREKTKLGEDKAFELFKEAQQQFKLTNYERALEFFDQAISIYPISPLLYARRGQTFLKLNKPMNCINDCTKALKTVPDHVLARKLRGRAYMLLGEWNKAIADLVVIEEDDEAKEWLNKLLPMSEYNVAEDIIEESSNTAIFETNESGDAYGLLKEDLISKEFQDPEIVDALEKNPKLKKLFKKMLSLIEHESISVDVDHTEGDMAFNYFSKHFTFQPDPAVVKAGEEKLSDLPNCSEGVACLSDFSESIHADETAQLLEDEKWINTIKKHANFQDFNEDETIDSLAEFEEAEINEDKFYSHGDISD